MTYWKIFHIYNVIIGTIPEFIVNERKMIEKKVEYDEDKMREAFLADIWENRDFFI